DDQWRAEANAGFAAAEDEEAALEREIDDLVAEGTGGGAGFLVLNDFDADHEAAAANFADDGVFGDPGAEALEHLFTNGRGILHAFALDDIHGGERSGDADRVAAKGAGMRAGNPVHDFRTG